MNGTLCADMEACVMDSERCDGFMDCSDHSDEDNCTGERAPDAEGKGRASRSESERERHTVRELCTRTDRERVVYGETA